MSSSSVLSDVHGLDFRPGVGVQEAIKDRFGLPVSIPAGSGFPGFFLLASFGRCKFRLNEGTLGAILQATIGGVAADFRTQQIDDRLFRSVVASKAVGFHIYKLKSFECQHYKIFFNLWGNGGASWTREARQFEREEDDSWTLVQ